MAIPWITLTPADLPDYLLGAQVAALRTRALAAGQPDPAVQHIRDQCERARNLLRGRPGNQVSATPWSIPPELRAALVPVILREMQARLAPALPLSQDQREQAARGDRDILRAAEGTLSISLPADPETLPAVARAGAIELAAASAAPLPTSLSLSGL